MVFIAPQPQQLQSQRSLRHQCLSQSVAQLSQSGLTLQAVPLILHGQGLIMLVQELKLMENPLSIIS